MGISSNVSLAGAQLWIEAPLMLMHLSLGRSRAHPSLGRLLRLLGQPLDFLGPGGPEKKLFDP